MATTVVNLYKSKFDVYIGRPGKGQDGFFGNPVRISQTCPICGGCHTTAGTTLPCYERYLQRRMRDPEFVVRLKQIQGTVLGCFCKPGPCHGDVLARYADSLG